MTGIVFSALGSTSGRLISSVGVTGEVAALVAGCDRLEIERKGEVDGAEEFCESVYADRREIGGGYSFGVGTLSCSTIVRPRLTSASSKL